MESASEMVPFPLLQTPIESNYRACTIPYRFPSDNPRRPTPTELAWIDSFKKRAESDPTVPDAQDEKNAEAISLFSDVVNLNDAIEDEGKHLENLVRGIFAGTIFDLGSAQAIIFADNSGADIILGILRFARELLHRGT